MLSRSSYRGHPIVAVDDDWVYEDTRAPVSDDKGRGCGFCHLANADDGHDPCIGELRGVMNACCGHGIEAHAYVQFDDGTVLRESAAVRHFAAELAERERADG